MRTRAQRRNTISRWFILFILLTSGAAAAVGFWTFGESQQLLSQATKTQSLPDPDLAVLLDEDSLDIAIQSTVDDSLARPLWSTTRRPYVPPKKPEPKKPEPQKLEEPPKVIPPLKGQLTSVMVVGDLKIIFLHTEKGVIRLEPGMAYNGWVLTSVNPDSAVFHYDEEEKVLELRTFATAESKPARTLGKSKQ